MMILKVVKHRVGNAGGQSSTVAGVSTWKRKKNSRVPASSTPKLADSLGGATHRVWVAGLAVWTAAIMLVPGGCEQVDPKQGYTNRTLYRTDVETVFVEMFDSESFRRGIEYELTHALAVQLELHSPYKVVSDRRKADTILYGSIIQVTERRIARQRELDRPLANEVVLAATFSWKDLRSADMLIEDKKVRVSGDYVAFLGAGRDSAAREAANEMAIRIVEAMEEEW